MATVLVHLSDLHFKHGNPESLGVVLDALLDDIQKQLSAIPGAKPYLVFSGDLVKEGEDESSYEALLGALEQKLKRAGIGKDRVLCAPGNHDACRKIIKAELPAHEGMVQQLASEAQFNEHIRRPSVLTRKFANFQRFSANFSSFGIGESALGAGWDLPDGVGVYVLNTALCSGAGLSDLGGNVIQDKGRLAIDTRGLHEWLQKKTSSFNILVMHHPLDWLCDWAKREVQALLGKNVQLLLTGHTHEQDSYCAIGPIGQYVHCHAPALYTRKSDPLGYAIIEIGSGAVKRIAYRQWTGRHVFVAGTAFSHNDVGVVVPGGAAAPDALTSQGQSQLRPEDKAAKVERILQDRLESSLRCFATQPFVFAEPIISRHSEVVRDKGSKPKETYSTAELLQAKSAVVHALPLFGLTCLARHLALVAWRETGSAWLYLDAKRTKPNKNSVAESVAEELSALGIQMSDVEGIVVDSLRSSDSDAPKLVKKIVECYPGIRLICMRTNDGVGTPETFAAAAGISFESFFLWAMPRSGIRKVVAAYLDAKPIGDEDAVTSKIASDIEVMNIHRTPLNCITLLKVNEVEYDDSPVNRTEMIKRVLQLLFNVDEIPTYKARPDLKDCEYVLGYFCEQLLRTGETKFLREKFISQLSACCKDRLLDLDVAVVFDVLFANRIIVKCGNHFEFRFSYWIFYFAAQRMYHSKEFAAYMFEGMRYSQFPELIEFYTGMDRSREDAVRVLISDLRAVCERFQEKISLPSEFDMFSSAQWESSPAGLEQMKVEMNEGVQTSNLPASVKDQYADRNYDSSRPYTQDIQRILNEDSYNQMLQAMRAAARALRNSDYIDPVLKRELLNEILRVWEQASTVILILIPALAENGVADFDDVRYVLDGSFGETVQDRFISVLSEIPQNITSYYEDDLFSPKMAPLLVAGVESGDAKLRVHMLALVLIRKRPKGWRQVIQSYVGALPKNSFYLLDVYRCLQSQYQYSYAQPQAIDDMDFLIRMAATKHVTGAKEPGIKLINKYKDQLKTEEGEDVVPSRVIDGAEVTVQSE